jgi:hypothetical protein
MTLFGWNTERLLQLAVLFHLDHDVVSFYLKLKPKDTQLNDISFNCCFTVHFDKFKAFLPTNALFIIT